MEVVIGGMTVLFDNQDAAILSNWQWHIHRTKLKCYVRGYPKSVRRKDAKLQYLHRVLTQATEDQDVDHEDGNGLNCRRNNLRPCTRTQNSANRDAIVSKTSRFKGVYFDSHSGKWRAEVQCNGEKWKSQRFLNEEDAGAAYAAKAKELFGAFANPAQRGVIK